MSESAPQPEQFAFNPDALFTEHLNLAFEAAAVIRVRLYAFLANHEPKTLQEVEKMSQIAEQLQQMADSLGA